MPSAKQKSSWPTRKLIAAVIVVPLVGFGAPAVGIDVGQETLMGLITAVAAVVGYLVPPSAQDQIEEVIVDLKKSESK